MTTKLHKTKNDLPEASRAKLVELLNSRLVSAIDLQTQAKHAHWNVKGPQFIALHELFDKVAEMAEDAIDEIAERAVQLGGVARGTARIVAKESALKEYALDAVSGAEHVEALSSALAAFGSQTRSAISLADELGDAGTADLFTSITQEADKQLWFVEAHGTAR